jgi:enterochelin esterase-like enzyme
MRFLAFAFCLVALLAPVTAVCAAESYPPHPDSQVHPGVPMGEIIKFTFADSKIFPGTTRDVTVYVPKQYDPAKPACVYVNQDGVQWGAPVVFDNLIAAGAMPVTIGVFATPGVVKSATPPTALDRFNRSLEYDGLGDAYARFLLDELLPAVEAKTTADGRAIHLSKSGNDRAIGGSSSGAIAAFTAAWERPDAFTRVFSAIGTYVGLRGGNIYPTLIRKTEPKPLRVFLQDGSADQNIYGGDWWMANQEMERALAYAGYEVNHAWGEGAHSGAQGTAIFPDVMRWLWKDWPSPVKAAPLKTDRLGPILIPGEGWQLLGEGYLNTWLSIANAQGEVFFPGGANGNVIKVALDGQVSLVSWSDAHLPKDNIPRVVAHNGNQYAAIPPQGDVASSTIQLQRPGRTVHESFESPVWGSLSSITLSPDQSLLYIADQRSHWIYSYVIQPDGTLANMQPYCWLHSADSADSWQMGASGIYCDRNGNIYAVTSLGIQVCDQAGRVNAILPVPSEKATGLVFGGSNFDTLFVTCGDKVFKRKLGVRGANGWEEPNKPAAPKL